MGNFQESIRFIDECNKRRSDGELEIYKHLRIIEKLEQWKKKEYYGGDIELANKFMKYSFSNFIRAAFNYTSIWYKNISYILALENGKDLFLRYGRSNMVTYLHSTPDERKKILEKADKSVVTCCFNDIKGTLFPSSKKRISSSSLLEKENKKLKNEVKQLKAQLKKIGKENEVLRNRIIDLEVILGTQKTEKDDEE